MTRQKFSAEKRLENWARRQIRDERCRCIGICLGAKVYRTVRKGASLFFCWEKSADIFICEDSFVGVWSKANSLENAIEARAWKRECYVA